MEEGLQNPKVSVFLEKARQDPRPWVTDFAKTVEPVSLSLKEQEIKGEVLIAGHGGFVPERIFVATSESGFDEIKPEITSLTLNDNESLSNEQIYFPKSNGKIVVLNGKLQEIAEQITEPKYDVVFFFRIHNLQRQLEDGLLDDIYRTLKLGGLFIGSGGFSSKEEAEKLLKTKFASSTVTALPNPDCEGLPYDKEHLGFKLQKISDSL